MSRFAEAEDPSHNAQCPITAKWGCDDSKTHRTRIGFGKFRNVDWRHGESLGSYLGGIPPISALMQI
jgi:hypothetical protein